VLEGPARIVDGDTLYIGTEKVLLYAEHLYIAHAAAIDFNSP
jgi:hypothetical protein